MAGRLLKLKIVLDIRAFS